MANLANHHRNIFRIIIAIILILSSAINSRSVQAQSYLADNFIIGFRPDTTLQERQMVLDALNVVAIRWLPQANAAQVTPRQADNVFASSVLDAAASYLTYIEQDAVVTGDLTPNDPAFSSLAHSYAQQIVAAPRGWNFSTGITETVIAILDSGITAEHPEFAGRVLAGYDFINDDDDPSDDHGHGTHVAGIAAAALNNEQGAAGICAQCSILPVKVLDSGNKGTWGTVAAGIYFAVDNGARVINLSLGATVSSRTLENAIQYAQEHDVLVVASAGNAGSTTPFYPAALPYVVAVGATADQDVLWPLSNTGEHIDLTAPGVRIYSTYNNLGYATMSGTSMAAPFVTGLIGLLASFKPELTGAELVDFITANADDLGDVGRDAQYGFGRINVHRTLMAANGGVDIPDDPEESEELDEPEVPEQPISPLPHESSAAIFLPVVTRN